MTHIEVLFTSAPDELKDILIALLSRLNYDGFEEIDGDLKGYIEASVFNKELLDELASSLDISYSVTHIPERNWNNSWESNFLPVLVHDFCSVRADFHPPVKNVKYDIVITPKMSFGTGHHATTLMMMQQMEHINFNGKTVLDFGTGTGVLAILAKKSGADKVIALDNDDWSILNAEENFSRNDVKNIVLNKADCPPQGERFDIILANITRNVILENFSFLRAGIKDKGTLLLSGLLKEDASYMLEKAAEYGFVPDKQLLHLNWISLRFTTL